MPEHVPDYVTLPLEDFEQLHANLRALRDMVSSHMDPRFRDVPVTQIASGLVNPWICASELEDLRERVREAQGLEEENWEKSREIAKLEGELDDHRVTLTVYEEDVPKEEQLEIVREAIRRGEL